VSDEGVIWFADINDKFSEELKQLSEGAGRYNSGGVDHSITAIGTPFRTGDIVTIDHRPSHLLSHALISCIIQDGYDCCGIQAAYLDEDGELRESSLKHDIGRVFPLFSCMLRLKKHTGELPGDEALLNTLREKTAGKYESMEHNEYHSFVDEVIDSLNENR
jgi:hypothetical protein